MTTHPPGHPSEPTGPGRDAERLLRLGEVIRDAERLAQQLIAVLKRDYDPASAPTVPAWSGISSDILAHEVLLAGAAVSAESVLNKLHLITKLPMPPVGSAVEVAFATPATEAERLAELIRAAARPRPEPS
jgi:hypothetical protein